jgi:hypothetical protein
VESAEAAEELAEEDLENAPPPTQSEPEGQSEAQEQSVRMDTETS